MRCPACTHNHPEGFGSCVVQVARNHTKERCGCDVRAQLSLSYTLRAPGADIVGTGPAIAAVNEVTAYLVSGKLVAYAHGPLVRKDGTVSRQRRGVRLDLWAEQPEWLANLILDARSRLI